jgi:hypothetical protein
MFSALNRTALRMAAPRMAAGMAAPRMTAVAKPQMMMMKTRGMASDAKLKLTGFQQFKHNWLSDVGAYPVMFIITGAVMFCTTVGLICLTKNPDVRISKARRGAVMRTSVQ